MPGMHMPKDAGLTVKVQEIPKKYNGIHGPNLSKYSSTYYILKHDLSS